MKLICFLFVAFVMVSVEANSIATRDIGIQILHFFKNCLSRRKMLQNCFYHFRRPCGYSGANNVDDS